jgi:hypothetical protein
MDSYYRDKKQKEDKYKRTLKKALSKGDNEKIKSLRTDYALNPIDKEKSRFMNEKEYLRILKEKIVNLEKKRIDTYYDIFYDLQDSMEEYDSYKNDLDKLKRLYDSQLKIKTDREEKNKSSRDILMNEINENIAIYKFMEMNDKKESYLKIRELGKRLMDKKINIIPGMEEGKVVFRSIINYEPVVDIKI